MKNLKLILILFASLIFASCTTYTKVTISGKPNTGIYEAIGESNRPRYIGTIANDGYLTVKLSDDHYYAYLLSRAPGTEKYIPFALDYEHAHKNNEAKHNCTLGFAWGFVWAAPIAFQLAIGGMILEQVAYENEYKYLRYQQTNDDMAFTEPVFTSILTNNVVNSNSIASSKSGKKLKGSQSSHILKDDALKLEGTYVGTGSLTKGSVIIEQYPNIKVKIVRKSNSSVSVNVFEADGSKFFITDSEYTIEANPNGKFKLTMTGIGNATIEIDTSNHLIYLHPRVNIENDIYVLKINATKE